ncbi:MAG: PipX family protein [Cyanobacteria bacterium P01_D01_bin.36]
MSNENYLNHPNFGLLFRVCLVGEGQELFATLYAHRLFFVVTNGSSGLSFEPIGRVEAKQMIDQRLRVIRRMGEQSEYDQLQKTYKQAF